MSSKRKTTPKRLTKTVTVSIHPELLDKATTRREQQNRTFSGYVQSLIIEDLKERVA